MTNKTCIVCKDKIDFITRVFLKDIKTCADCRHYATLGYSLLDILYLKNKIDFAFEKNSKTGVIKIIDER